MKLFERRTMHSKKYLFIFSFLSLIPTFSVNSAPPFDCSLITFTLRKFHDCGFFLNIFPDGAYQWSIDNGVTWQDDANFKFDVCSPCPGGTYSLPYTANIVVRAKNDPNPANWCFYADNPLLLQAGGINFTNVSITNAQCNCNCNSDCVCDPQLYNISQPCSKCFGNITFDIGATESPIAIYIRRTPSGTDTFVGSFSNNSTVSICTCPGSYVITARTNGNLCSGTLNATITAPNAIVLNSSATNVTCNGLSNGSITVTVSSGGVAPFLYEIVSGPVTRPFQGSGNFNNLPAGNYTILVMDTNGCTKTIQQSISQPDLITFGLQSVKPCYSQANGSISVINVSGGSGPYQYSLNNSTWQSSNTFSNLMGGIYTVYVRDSLLCTVSKPIDLSQLNPVSFDYFVQQPTCTDPTGSIIVNNITGGNPDPILGYCIELTIDGVLQDCQHGFQANFTNLNPGSYDIRVHDPFNCDAVVNGIYLIAAETIEVQITHENVESCEYDNGSITINITSGTGETPYTYHLNNQTVTSDYTSYTFENLGVGTYSVYVSDSSYPQCASPAQLITVTNEEGPLHIQVSHTDVSCFDAHDGTITIIAYGESEPLLYSIDGGATLQDNGIFTHLAPGTYSIIVQDIDYDCKVAATQTITEPKEIEIDPLLITQPLCYEELGSVKFEIEGGKPPYTVYLDGNPVLFDVPEEQIVTLDVGAGSHTITATDSTQPYPCAPEDPLTVNIAQPSQLNFSIQTTSVTCFNGSDGSITVTAVGGTPPYTFFLNNTPYQSQYDSYIFENLNAGSYTVDVHDVNGCTSGNPPVTVEITQPTRLIFSNFVIASPACYGDDGSVSFDVHGGNPPYSITFDGQEKHAAEFEEVIFLAQPGTYSITVLDTYNCSLQTQVTIPDAPAKLIISATATQITCSGLSNGSITINATGGTLPYLYSIDALNYTVNNVFTNLSAGNYTAYVKDAHGCMDSMPIVVPDPGPIVLTYSSESASCNGLSDGSLTVEVVSGGTQPFEYQITAGPVIRGPQSTGFFDNLPAGNYSVLVTDIYNCSNSIQASVSQPDLITFALQTQQPCYGEANGTITVVNVSGGTGEYEYSLDNATWQSSNVFENLAAGNYIIYVRDYSQCEVSKPVNLSPFNAISFNVTLQQPTCDSQKGSITVDYITGGDPDPILGYCIELTINGQLQDCQHGFYANFTNLDPGVYDIRVHDPFNCSATENGIYILAAPTIDISISKTNVTNCDYTNGSITIIVNYGTGIPPYTYHLNDTEVTSDESSYTFENLDVGVYHVYVSDSSYPPCKSEIIDVVIQNDISPFTINVTSSNVSCYGAQDGQIIITTSGGTGPFIYSIDNGNSWHYDGTFDGLSPNSYDIIVEDLSSNCKVTTNPITITQPKQIEIDLLHIVQPLCFGLQGSVIFEVAGGVPPYTIYLDGNPVAGDIAEEQIVTIPVQAGYHTITASDSSQPYPCNSPDPLTCYVIQPEELNFTTQISPVTCFGGNDGSIQVTASGGTTPYTFFLNNSPFGPAPSPYTFGNLIAGSYTVDVHDSNACTTGNPPVTLEIDQPTQIEINGLTIISPVCAGQNGSVSFNVTGGSSYPYYIITFDGQEKHAQESEQVTFTAPSGSYIITVQDSQGCTINLPVQIQSGPDPLIISVTTSPVICAGQSTGSISIHASGGTPLYSYSIDGIHYGTNNTFTNLPAGNYTAYVKDANDCIASTPVSLSRPCFPLNRLIPVRKLTHGAPIQSVSWLCDENCPIKLAAFGGYSCSDQCIVTSIDVYRLDTTNDTLIKIDIDQPLPTPYVYSVDWTCINGTPYLAVGGCPDAQGNSVWIYQYASGQLTFVQSFKHYGTIYTIKWLNDGCTENQNSRFIAIGGEPVSGIDTRLLIFNTYTETLNSTADLTHGSTIYAICWSIRNNNCPLLITGGKTTNTCEGPVNLRTYSFDCSEALTLITSSYYKGEVVRTLSCCCNTNLLIKVPLILVGGDPIPQDQYPGPNAVIYYFDIHSHMLKPLAYTQQQEKVFASTWIPGCNCNLLALGSGCIHSECDPNIGLYSLDCNNGLHLIKTGAVKFDDNITTIAACKINNITYVIAGTETNSWNCTQQIDPLCSSAKNSNEIALYKGIFCYACPPPSCMPVSICMRKES